MRLVAIKKHNFPVNSRTVRNVGDEYEVNQVEAVVLIAHQLAKPADSYRTSNLSYETKEMKPRKTIRRQLRNKEMTSER